MSRILKRPMFRKGGSTNEGIMHGIVDRKGYRQGTTWEETLEKYPDIEEAYGAIGGIDQPRDTSMYEMLIGGGLNLVSGAGAGDGLMSNVAKSYKGPSEKYFEAQRARKAYDSELKRAAAQAGLQQKWKMDQIAAQKSDTTNQAFKTMYYKDADELGMSQQEAERYADFHMGLKDQLRNEVSGARLGGVIEFDLSDPKNNERKDKFFKDKVGRVFYDPYDGLFKEVKKIDGEIMLETYTSIQDIRDRYIPEPVETAETIKEKKRLEQEKIDKRFDILNPKQKEWWEGIKDKGTDIDPYQA